jgi:hypothetical protein
MGLTKKTVYDALPDIIKGALITSEGYLVGGALRDMVNGDRPKDFDIIVPYHKWKYLVIFFKHQGAHFALNTFGGHKYRVPDGCGGYIFVDAWPEEVGSYLKTLGRSEYLYSVSNNVFIKLT